MINNKSYQLDFGSGLCWGLYACGALDEWLDKMAYILRLEPAETNNNMAKIIFCKPGNFSSVREWYQAEYRDLSPGRNRTDWSVYDKKHIRICINNTTSDVICEIDNYGFDNYGFNDSSGLGIYNMFLSLYPIFRRVQDGGGLHLHAALLELDGQGIILAAAGGTGKTTSCRRLQGYWLPLSDDEAVVVYVPENGYRSHPFPTWSEHLYKPSDKAWNVQHSVPLRALFFLEQAENDEVIPLCMGRAAASLNQSAIEISSKYWRSLDDEAKRSFSKLQFDNACNMVKSIPAFTLRASLHGRFWEEIEKTLVNI